MIKNRKLAATWVGKKVRLLYGFSGLGKLIAAADLYVVLTRDPGAPGHDLSPQGGPRAFGASHRGGPDAGRAQ